MTDNDAPGGGFVRPPYDRATIYLHWVTFALVVGQFATALSIDHVEPATAKLLLTTHRSTGVALWLLVAFRLVWRFTGMRLPPFPPSMKPWHIRGVHLSEYGLYALLLVQPLTGMADTLLRGRAFDLILWRVPVLIARDRSLAGIAHVLHEAGAVALGGLVGLHAAAALFHHLVLKDGILPSMLPLARRRATAPPPPPAEPEWPDTLEA
jgi:cytochrome b561